MVTDDFTFFALCNSEDGQGQEVPGTLQNILTFHLFVLLVSGGVCQPRAGLILSINTQRIDRR